MEIDISRHKTRLVNKEKLTISLFMVFRNMNNNMIYVLLKIFVCFHVYGYFACPVRLYHVWTVHFEARKNARSSVTAVTISY